MAAELTCERAPKPLRKKSPSGTSTDGSCSPSQYARSTRSRSTKAPAGGGAGAVVPVGPDDAWPLDLREREGRAAGQRQEGSALASRPQRRGLRASDALAPARILGGDGSTAGRR